MSAKKKAKKPPTVSDQATKVALHGAIMATSSMAKMLDTMAVTQESALHAAAMTAIAQLGLVVTGLCERIGVTGGDA